MTYVFQHKTETNRIKMIEASNIDDTKTKLADRLYARPIMINGVKIADTLFDYEFSFLI